MGENCHKRQCDMIPDEIKKFDGIHMTGASSRQFLWWRGEGGGLCKSWTSYPGQHSDLSEGAPKTK